MTVYLVGAGPGDPGLLTRRGAELLSRAEVVVYDRLVDNSLLTLVPDHAVLIDAGKRSASPGAQAQPRPATQRLGETGAARQQEINELLVRHGRAGRLVVRLKGGDPYLFGRGGEEAEALRTAGVPYAVVPGVPSAFAVPASAGVPVTHRGLSTSVTVVTGHVGDATAPGGVDWESLARAGGTLVVLMGIATRAEIARRLQAGGRAATTPVAVVEWGTTPSQRTTRATLGELASLEVGSPAVIVVGAVADLDFTPAAGRPLAGWTVVVTRPAEAAAGLTAELELVGAAVLEVPAIAVAEPPDGGVALLGAADRVASYDWVVFTSANAVHRFVPLLRDGRRFGQARLAVVGWTTARALASYTLEADLVSDQPTGAGLAAAFAEADPGGSVLFPKAAAAGPSLPEGLRAKGWRVDEVVAYQTVPAPAPDARRAAEIARADAVTFTSPSSVDAWCSWRDAEGAPLPLPPVVACLGPVTTAAAREAGLAVTVESATPSNRALVEALVGRTRPGG